MTTGASGGYQPPGGERPLGASTDPLTDPAFGAAASGATSGDSKTETAKAQASEVGSTAKQAGGQVAGTAKDQAMQVAGETKAQARNLLDETRTQVRAQAGTQQQKAAGGLRSFSDELRSMATGQGGQPGVVTDYAQQAADKLQEFAGMLESKEPGDLIDDLRSMARRKPGMFLIGAAAAGVVAGRLTRGAVDAKRSESESSTGYDNGSFGRTGQAFAGSSGTMSGDTFAGSTLDRDDDIVLVEETVVVETDPFGPRTQHSTVGGDRL